MKISKFQLIETNWNNFSIINLFSNSFEQEKFQNSFKYFDTKNYYVCVRAAGPYEDMRTGPNQVLKHNTVLRTGPNQVLRPKKGLKTSLNQVLDIRLLRLHKKWGCANSVCFQDNVVLFLKGEGVKDFISPNHDLKCCCSPVGGLKFYFAQCIWGHSHSM